MRLNIKQADSIRKVFFFLPLIFYDRSRLVVGAEKRGRESERSIKLRRNRLSNKGFVYTTSTSIGWEVASLSKTSYFVIY